MKKKTVSETIAKNLRGLLFEARWTQDDLAKKSGYSISTVSNIINARYKNVGLQTVQDIANALGVDAKRLFND